MIFFEFAKRSIRLHWLRSTLAALGIIIGVVAISSMGMLGNSLTLSVTSTLSSVGDSVIVVPMLVSGGMGTSTGDAGITERQVQQIERAVGTNPVIPVYQGASRFEVGGETGTATVYGIHPDQVSLLADIAEGVGLRGAGGALVGAMLAEDHDLRPGSKVALGSESVRVVGILEERGMGFDISPDRAFIVSGQWYSSARDQDDYDQVIVKVADLDSIETVKENIDRAINRRDDVVTVYDTRMILEMITSTFEQISLFTTAIGGISLVVAGVSIFNVQMMSVTERIKEIGIIRSIGTRRREVMKMFLYEALLLGVVGSVIGGVLSFAGGYLAVMVMLQTTEFLFVPSTLVYIPFGMAFGITTSLLSGLYPAWKAANLRPIEALRHE
ncbi:MAG: ABC transporter permease [Methanomicrobiales archaeon]